jgi:hypothetical protein
VFSDCSIPLIFALAENTFARWKSLSFPQCSKVDGWFKFNLATVRTHLVSSQYSLLFLILTNLDPLETMKCSVSSDVSVYASGYLVV